LGRIPFIPGTCGSLAGVVWTAALLAASNLWWFLGGALAGVALSVWVCGQAERILGQTDPGSVVLDEISAVPLCFLSWLLLQADQTGRLPLPADLFSRENWLVTLAIFGAFRLLDAAKPWPIRQSQRLPGGWGVTVDDVLAAVGVNLPFAAALVF
jgi:phosphatidylglycerophosphatase A